MSVYDFTGIVEWNKIKGWFSLDKAVAIQRVVKQLPVGSKLVELGCTQGRSSVAIASVLPPDSVLYSVDNFKRSPEDRTKNLDLTNFLEAFTKNIEQFGVKDKISTLAMSPAEAAEQFEPESVDLILLNAAHDYQSVKLDLLQWYPKLKQGGFLFCDDYAPNWPGSIRAINTVGLEGQLAAPALWCHRKPEI